MNTNQKNEVVLSLITKQNNYQTNLDVFSQIIGQEEAKNKLTFFVKSHSEKTPFPTLLFTGSQGLGKSYTALQVSKALNREFIEINCSNYETTKDFVEKILIEKIAGETPKTILFDEAQQLSPDITTILLSLLNPNDKYYNYLNYNGLKIKFDLHQINVILATTDAHKIFKPLLNRCNEIYFNKYTNKELYDMLNFYLKTIKFTCNFEDITYACRGRARNTFILSQNIKRYCTMKNIDYLDDKGWDEIKKVFGIYSYGLNSQEIDFLNILNENHSLSSKSIALKMGINLSNVESEIEPRPMEIGLIENTLKGRQLTAKGKKYIKDMKLNYQVAS